MAVELIDPHRLEAFAKENQLKAELHEHFMKVMQLLQARRVPIPMGMDIALNLMASCALSLNMPKDAIRKMVHEQIDTVLNIAGQHVIDISSPDKPKEEKAS